MKKEFGYKELDTEGEQILDVIEGAKNFNAWMYSIVHPHLSGNILEVGSGTGNISEQVIKARHRICLSDIRENYCERLRQKFACNAAVTGVFNLDLVHDSFDEVYKDHLERYDAIFALNVVEHIEDHVRAIANCRKMLKKGGKLIILVPAYQWLYNSFDKELYHYRRYSTSLLKEIFIKNDLHIKKAFHFNCFGIPGWFVSGKLQKNKTIPKGQMQFFDKLVPVMKLLDLVTLRWIGLSVVVVGEK